MGIETGEKSCGGDDASQRTAEVVCQDIHLMPAQQRQAIDDGFVQDAVQLVNLSETILKMFAEANKDLVQVQ